MSEIDERVTPTPRGIVIVASKPEYKDDDNDTLMDHLQAMSFNHNHVETLFEMPEALDVRAELTARLAQPTVTREDIRAAVASSVNKYAYCVFDAEIDSITNAIMAVLSKAQGGE